MARVKQAARRRISHTSRNSDEPSQNSGEPPMKKPRRSARNQPKTKEGESSMAGSDVNATPKATTREDSPVRSPTDSMSAFIGLEDIDDLNEIPETPPSRITSSVPKTPFKSKSPPKTNPKASSVSIPPVMETANRPINPREPAISQALLDAVSISENVQVPPEVQVQKEAVMTEAGNNVTTTVVQPEDAAARVSKVQGKRKVVDIGQSSNAQEDDQFSQRNTEDDYGDNTISTSPVFESDDPLGMLSTKEAQRKYPIFAAKAIHPTKGFSTRTLANYPSIASIVKELKWSKLCAVPKPITLDWIKEFYAEAAATKGNVVRVRGTEVDFSPEAINKIYGLKPPEPSELSRIMNIATEDDYNNILTIVGKPGIPWNHAENPKHRTYFAQSLNAEANIWFHFLRHTVSPTSHDTTLCVERMAMLYCILTRKPFDVGLALNQIIRQCADKHSGPMFAPGLIQSLMVKAKVRRLTSDQIITTKAMVEGKTIHRLLTNSEKNSKKQATMEATTAAGTDDQIEGLKKMIKELADQNKEILDRLEKGMKELGEKVDDNNTAMLNKMKRQKEKMDNKMDKAQKKMMKRFDQLDAKVRPTPQE